MPTSSNTRFVVSLVAAGLTACGGQTTGGQNGDPRGPVVVPGSDSRNAGDPGGPGDLGSPGADPDGPIEDGAIEINPGWIGGACRAPTDCNDSNLSGPTCERTDFPNGFCSQACTQSPSTGSYLCPDTNYSSSLSTISRCIDAIGSPKCVAECDFDKSPTGCRPGYLCMHRTRFGAPDSTFPVCLPTAFGGWPGESAPPNDIGRACISHDDCAHSFCLQIQDGYCSKAFCNRAGCPTDSECFEVSGDDAGGYSCMRTCEADNDCRPVGYECDGDDTCWALPQPDWDPSAGAVDCAAWWGTNGEPLSPCDTTRDDYVVLNKQARNVALCQAGTAVKNYPTGLGFSPVGDKQVNGDGRTPEGVFYIARRVDPSNFYLALLFSYPDNEDVTRGLTEHIISQEQALAIQSAQANCTEPPQTTPLGGLIEIHGNHVAGGSDWTLGCAAIVNWAMDELFETLEVGDTIVVLP